MDGSTPLPTPDSANDHKTGVSHGVLSLIRGCMFSGKTTRLLDALEGYAPEQVAAFKHEIDRRYSDDEIVSHNGRAWSAVHVGCSDQIADHLNSVELVVAIDEAHFFDDGLVDAVRTLLLRCAAVIVTSLDRDSWGRPFPLVERLAELATDCVDATARCARCGAEADRTQRLTPIVNGQMVGGPGKLRTSLPRLLVTTTGTATRLTRARSGHRVERATVDCFRAGSSHRTSRASKTGPSVQQSL